MIKNILLISTILLTSCKCTELIQPVETPQPPVASPVLPMTPTEDPTPETRPARLCAAYIKLGCIEGTPSPEGIACVNVVENALEASIDLTEHLDCVENALDCVSARACN